MQDIGKVVFSSKCNTGKFMTSIHIVYSNGDRLAKRASSAVWADTLEDIRIGICAHLHDLLAFTSDTKSGAAVPAMDSAFSKMHFMEQCMTVLTQIKNLKESAQLLVILGQTITNEKIDVTDPFASFVTVYSRM